MTTEQIDAPVKETEVKEVKKTSNKKKTRKSTPKNRKLVKANLRQTKKKVTPKNGNGNGKAVAKKKVEEKPAKKESSRVLQYIYAEDMTSAEKKTFRRQTRALIRGLYKKIEAIQAKESKTKEDKIELKRLNEELGKAYDATRNPEHETFKGRTWDKDK